MKEKLAQEDMSKLEENIIKKRKLQTNFLNGKKHKFLKNI